MDVQAAQYIPDVYAALLRFEESGELAVNRWEARSEADRRAVWEMTVRSVCKNGYLDAATEKAAFYRRHFPVRLRVCRRTASGRADGLCLRMGKSAPALLNDGRFPRRYLQRPSRARFSPTKQPRQRLCRCRGCFVGLARWSRNRVRGYNR